MRLQLDNCSRCLGFSGGMPGDENIIGGRVLCDDCHVAVTHYGAEREIYCTDCERPYSQHRVMDTSQLETAWENGIVLTICGAIPWPAEPPRWLVAVDDKPKNPCDEEFMRGIST